MPVSTGNCPGTRRRERLIPVLEPVPHLRKGLLESVADPDREVLFLHAPPRGQGWTLVIGVAPTLGTVAIPLQQDQAFASVLTRSPVIVVLVRADRFRQSILPAEEVDGAGLAIIARQDSRFGAHLRRQRVINSRDGLHHLRPAKLVAEVLR